MSGIYFKLTDEERRLIEKKMELAGIKNMSAYIRKMCIDGYIIRLQLPELNICSKLLRSAANNLNQIARRVNSGDVADMDELRETREALTEASRLFGNIMEHLSKIK